MALHGPHHSAKQSTTTRPASGLRTFSSNSALLYEQLVTWVTKGDAGREAEGCGKQIVVQCSCKSGALRLDLLNFAASHSG